MRVTTAAKSGYQEHWISAQDGLSLYVREYGFRESPGTPVVCLSGLVRNSRDFHDLAERFRSDRRVVCPDYRGRGLSSYDSDWRNYNPYVYLLDIQHVLNALNVPKAVFYGVSMGGLLTMALGAMAATRVAGAVLIDVGPEIDAKGLGRIGDYVGRDVSLADMDEAMTRLRGTWQANPRWSDADWRQMAEGTFQEAPDGRLHVNWDTSIAKSLQTRDTETNDMWAVFRSLARVPVLAVRGALSDILSAETFSRMGHEMPGMTGLELDGVGHTPVPHDLEIVEALDALLHRCDSASSERAA